MLESVLKIHQFTFCLCYRFRCSCIIVSSIGEDPDLTWTEKPRHSRKAAVDSEELESLFGVDLSISDTYYTGQHAESRNTQFRNTESSPPQILQTSRRNKREILQLKKSAASRSASNRALEFGKTKRCQRRPGKRFVRFSTRLMSSDCNTWMKRNSNPGKMESIAKVWVQKSIVV